MFIQDCRTVMPNFIWVFPVFVSDNNVFLYCFLSSFPCSLFSYPCSPASSRIRIQTEIHFDRKERHWLWRHQVCVGGETLVAYLLCAEAVRRSFPPNIPMLAWSSSRRISCCSFVNTDQPWAHWHGNPTVVGAPFPVGHFLNKTITAACLLFASCFRFDFWKR